MSEKQKEYYSSREAAELLGVAVSTIQLWTNNGLLSAWTTGGGHRRIARASVEGVLKQQKISTESKQQSQAPAPAAVNSQLSVVVVEDSEQQLRLYKKQFLAWHLDADITTARDGYEGLIRIGRTLPDIIITDLKMPNMDGFQMIRALKELPELAHSMIIVVTGLKEDEIKAKGGLPEGVHAFTKPVPFNELKALIRQKVNVKAA